MNRGSFKDNIVYALNGKDYPRVFHKGPCIAVEYNKEGSAYKNIVQIINFFYPEKEEKSLSSIKIGDSICSAYDINQVHSLVDCNDNWIYCLEEVE